MPNITGSLYSYANGGANQITGAFFGWLSENTVFPSVQSQSTSRFWGGVSFDASRSNSLYGSSDTIQPPAITLLSQIKY
nr:MAG TPA_asm: hypothetical protein [Caudoviricetes sp.]